MAVPGPVGYLSITAGDASLFVSFTAPTIGGPEFTYGYKLRVNSSPFLPPAIPWNVVPIPNTVISIPLGSNIVNGNTYSIVIIPSNTNGTANPIDWIESGTVTPSAAILDMSFTEPVNGDGTVTADVTGATLQSGNNTDTLSWSYPGTSSSTVEYDITPPNQSNTVMGNVDLGSQTNAGINSIAGVAASSVGGTVGSVASLSSTETNFSGNDVQQTGDVVTDYTQIFTNLSPELNAATSITLYIYKVQDGIATLINSVKATLDKIQKQLKAVQINLGKPTSVYIFIYKTSSGTTITVPVENNQAYNDYLHDESGYQNRRENRLLTSGFYRGPVDSSTLTRIRSANGVLLGVPGVPGGMQGSRCCP